MIRTTPYHALGVMTLGLSLQGQAVVAVTPNILLITTDDQGLQAGCYGDPLARTPNIDRLASEGTRFTRGYVTQSSCSPSRSSILTGLYPHQNGQVGLTNNFSMQDGIQTLPAMLNAAGYRTGLIGKLHVNPPSAFPFDFWEVRNPLETRFIRRVNGAVQQFLDADLKQPFFLMVNFFDPHAPYNEAANQCEGLPEKPYGPNDIRPFDYMGVDTPELRKDVAIYYNCVSRADTGIGLVLESLKARGMDRNTLVIFLSDNGPDFTRGKATCYEAGLHVPFIARYPQCGQPGQVRDELVSSVDIVPTILEAVGAKIPGTLPGRSLLPLLRGDRPQWRTSLFAEYTAHGIQQYYPRRSVCRGPFKLIENLLPDRPFETHGVGGVVQALGKTEPLRERNGRYTATSTAFYDEPGSFFGASADVIRQSFLTFLNPPEFEFYDIGKDPYERINLAGNPEYAQVLQQMKADLKQCRETLNDPFNDLEYTKEFSRRADEMNRNREFRVPFQLP
ncbi:MAG: sulfatase-like hydrolase/transferase [Kiritimatiellales bacterium]